MRPDDERITVLIVDDDDDFRLLVGAVLARDPDISVAGQARNAEDAVALARELLPDVVLLDLRMPATGEPAPGPPGRGGIDAAAAISRAVPTTKIVMLTGSDEDDDVYQALLAGASGYLLKADLLDDLTGVVRMVANSLALLLSPSIAAKVVTHFRAAPPHSVAPTLSPREAEVLRLVGLGRTNDQIATELSRPIRSSGTWPTSWRNCISIPAPTPSPRPPSTTPGPAESGNRAASFRDRRRCRGRYEGVRLRAAPPH